MNRKKVKEVFELKYSVQILNLLEKGMTAMELKEELGLNRSHEVYNTIEELKKAGLVESWRGESRGGRRPMVHKRTTDEVRIPLVMKRKDGKEKAAEHMERAEEELDEAKDELNNRAQRRHVDEIKDEVEKTKEAFEDQAESDE